MKKIILVDGNNLMFRSYYATAYTGNVMKNSKGFPTNALYGFTNMINKIINEEKPEYMAVAFDIGRNFRHDKYDHYKAGRIEMPDDLGLQMPVARHLLTAMGIRFFELEPYEADDIIGTFAKMADEDEDFIATIVSSDKDLLQLISSDVDVKLLKQKDYIRYNRDTFVADYGIEPINIIDLKAIAGDSSDNIPGVKGIGEKGALKLLQEYRDLETIYENIEKITGKTKEKLIEDKDNAFMSKEIATIYKDVPLNVCLDDIKYTSSYSTELNDLFEELEFYSFINKQNVTRKPKKLEFKEITDISELVLEEECSFYLEVDNVNYHRAEIIGLSISDKKNNYFVNKELVADAIKSLKGKKVSTFDLKKSIVVLSRLNMEIKADFDTMIAVYLLGINMNKDDIAYLMNPQGISVEFYETLLKSKFVVDNLPEQLILKSRFIYDTKEEYLKMLKDDEVLDLYANIEHPLIEVLANMEIEGIKVDRSVLEDMREETKVKMLILTRTIYNEAGVEFNVASPKQLGEVLFDRLMLPGAKKSRGGNYKTDVKVLHKLLGVHSIIEHILEYRNLNKLYTTYLEGLIPYIYGDEKIHTIYRQNITRTGRLSSVDPNMQNIPTKDEDGRKVRRAFIPVNDCFMCCDYSQMELRILAHISGEKEMIRTFENNEDIHTHVAADIYEVPEANVTKKMRKTAKAVIFGIVYGISGFGLGENLEISPKDAKNFIDKYYELYPDVKKYMDSIIEDAYNKGYVRTLLNRKRVIDELQNANYMIRQGGERIALNTPIQGTSADIIKKAMVEIYQEMQKQNIKSKMLLQVHDELVFDVLLEEKELLEKIVVEIMENTYPLSVPMKVSADYGNNWYEAK